MVIKAEKMWGVPGGMEAQRADLWVLDLEQVLAGISQSSIASKLAAELNLPIAGTTKYYARNVMLPELRIGEMQSNTFNTPKTYPGLDDPVGQVRVDFAIDAATFGAEAGSARSKIYDLIYAWRILSRVGRMPYSSADLWAPLPASAISSSLGSTFKFDVKLYLLRGFDGTVDVSQTDLAGTHFVASSYILRRCWPSTLQLGPLDQTGSNTIYTMTTALNPEEIYPTG